MSSSQNHVINDVTDTAFWVALYRANELKRSHPLFTDHLAQKLIDQKAEAISKSLNEISRHAEFNVVMRTLVIDRFILNLIENKKIDCVINLGAGLDTRPYRLRLPSEFKWIEVDHAKIISYKEQKLESETPVCSLQRISLDLSKDTERRELFCKLNQQCQSAVILTEGVLPYLTEQQVSLLSEDIRAQSHFRYWIADYLSAHIYKYFRSKQRLEKMKNAPFQFFPSDWLGFFEKHSWKILDLQYLSRVGLDVGRKPPAPWWVSIIKLFMSEASKKKFLEMSGYMLMTKS